MGVNISNVNLAQKEFSYKTLKSAQKGLKNEKIAKGLFKVHFIR